MIDSLRGAVGRALPAQVGWPIVYLLVTIAAGLLGLGAVVNAFSADPALWPSEFWRYAGAVLISAGFVASVFAAVAFFRWRSRR